MFHAQFWHTHTRARARIVKQSCWCRQNIKQKRWFKVFQYTALIRSFTKEQNGKAVQGRIYDLSLRLETRHSIQTIPYNSALGKMRQSHLFRRKSYWDTEIMNRIWGQPFPDWFERNDMNSLFCYFNYFPHRPHINKLLLVFSKKGEGWEVPSAVSVIL